MSLDLWDPRRSGSSSWISRAPSASIGTWDTNGGKSSMEPSRTCSGRWVSRWNLHLNAASWKLPELNGGFHGKVIKINGGSSVAMFDYRRDFFRGWTSWWISGGVGYAWLSTGNNHQLTKVQILAIEIGLNHQTEDENGRVLSPARMPVFFGEALTSHPKNGATNSRKTLWRFLSRSFKDHPSLSPSHLLVGGIPTPLKNMSSSVGMMTFPIWWEK